LYELLSEVADALAPEPPKKVLPLQRSLEDAVLARLRAYANNLKGHAARDMYGLIMPQLERPLVRVAMELAHDCQRSAALMLGIHRNTLRIKLRELDMMPRALPAPKKRARAGR
jgi:DNA-binding protein Fis